MKMCIYGKWKMWLLSRVLLAAAAILAFASVMSVLTSCRQGVKADQFVTAVVDCAKANQDALLSTGSGVVDCLMSVVDPTSGITTNCLADLANAAGATAADVMCVIDFLSKSGSTETAKVMSSIMAQTTLTTINMQHRAALVLAVNHVTIENGWGR